MIPLRVLGDRPARIIESLDEQSQISFKVFAIWDSTRFGSSIYDPTASPHHSATLMACSDLPP